jgi:para-aminobenzoate synthetase component 1
MIKLIAEYKDPLLYLEKVQQSSTFAFLHSSLKSSYSGNYSVLAFFPIDEIRTNDFNIFSKKLQPKPEQGNIDYFSDGWFGYISYEAKHAFERLPTESKSFKDYPHFHFIRYGLRLVFHHEKKMCQLYASNQSFIDTFTAMQQQAAVATQPKLEHLSSNFDKDSYIEMVKKAQNYIRKGDIFEVNVSQKFTGSFSLAPSPIELYKQLIQLSPSHYSALLSFGTTSIISSSPERFLQYKNGFVTSKPIKGTRPRAQNPEEDEQIRQALASSEKDKAENAMIVDLVRNDLGKIATFGGVTVENLFQIERYKTVFQMVSTIRAQMRDKITKSDIIKATFPPGSMTGAPKIRAIEIASELEGVSRGIYSGALGYIGFDAYLDLSVIIRTLILHENKFEFQVGGAITADSNPEDEYKESMDKAAALLSLLNNFN